MVLEQKKDISIMATLNVKGVDKKIIFFGKPYFDDNGEISHVLTVKNVDGEMTFGTEDVSVEKYPIKPMHV